MSHEVASLHRTPNLEYSYPEGVTPEMIEEIAANRTRELMPTESFFEDGREQNLDVFTTTPPNIKGEEVVVRFLPWSELPDMPGTAAWEAHLAAGTGRVVKTVRFPGAVDKEAVDPSTADVQKMTHDQTENLKQGRYREIGACVLRAVGVESAVLFGTSAGAAAAAGAYGAKAETDIRAVILGEAVNIEERSPVGLALDFMKNNSTAGEYTNRNPEEQTKHDDGLGGLVHRIKESPGANWNNFMALSKGKLEEDLGPNVGDGDTTFYIVNGGDSKLSPAEANDALAERLHEKGADVKRIVYPDTDHGVTMNAQAMVDLVNEALGQ